MPSSIGNKYRQLHTKQDKSFFAFGDSLIAQLGGTEDQERLHSGNAYMVSSLNTSLNSGGTHVVAFSTPSSSGSKIDVHSMVQVKGDALFQIFEGATVVQGSGVTHTIYNRDRQAGTVSQILDLGATPTAGQISNGSSLQVSSEGTLIHQETIGLLGTSGEAGELLLKADTTYVFQIVSRSASNRVGLNFKFHER